MAQPTGPMALEVFGDESVFRNVVAYATVIVLPTDVSDLAREFARIKASYGQPEAAELHCRVLFNGTQRSRSPWRGLSMEDVFSLYGELADLLLQSRATLLCVFADTSRLPKRDPGGPWRTRSGLFLPESSPPFEFGDKQLASLCANATQTPLKEFPGLDRVRFWADPDRTRIAWAGSRRQAAQTVSMPIGHAGTVERVSTEPIPPGAEKPSLLQLADFVAYSFAKSRARRPSAGTLRFKVLADRLNPFVGQVKLGSDGGLGVSMPTRTIEVHLRAQAR